MVRCPACQHENAPPAKFCGECGARLERAGPQCGRENPAGNKFCAECGQRLASVEAPAQALRDAAPASYTPRLLAEKILTSRSALEGERKTVTVLFCDLQGSTALAERIGPERMHELLNRFFELALAVVHRYEGTVNQFQGMLAALRGQIESFPHLLAGVLKGEQPSLLPYLGNGPVSATMEQAMFLVGRDGRIRFRHIADVHPFQRDLAPRAGRACLSGC